MRRDQDGGDPPGGGDPPPERDRYTELLRIETRLLSWAFAGVLVVLASLAVVWAWILDRLSLWQAVTLMAVTTLFTAAVCLLGIVSGSRAYLLGRVDERGVRRG